MWTPRGALGNHRGPPAAGPHTRGTLFDPGASFDYRTSRGSSSAIVAIEWAEKFGSHRRHPNRELGKPQYSV